MGLAADILYDQYSRWMQRRDLERAMEAQRALTRVATPVATPTPADIAPVAPATAQVAQPAQVTQAPADAEAPSFLEFAQLAERAGVNPVDYYRALAQRRRLEFLSGPEVSSLPADQRLDAWNKRSVARRDIKGDTSFNRYGSDPGLQATPRGQSFIDYNAARAAQAKAAAGLRQAQTARARVLGDPVDVTVGDASRRAVLTTLPGGGQAYVLTDQPEGMRFELPAPEQTTTPRGGTKLATQYTTARRHAESLAGDEWEALDREEREQMIEASRAQLYPDEAGSAAGESFEWRGQAFRVGQELEHEGKRYAIVGQWPNGEPALEEIR